MGPNLCSNTWNMFFSLTFPNLNIHSTCITLNSIAYVIFADLEYDMLDVWKTCRRGYRGDL